MNRRRIKERQSMSTCKRKEQNRSGDERLRQKSRLFQISLWVSLILFQMIVVESMKVYASEHMPERKVESEGQKITIYSENYQKEEECQEPAGSYWTKEGVEYILTFWEREQITVPAQSCLVIKKGFCEGVEGITKLPESVTAKVEREGKQTEVKYLLEEKSVIKEEWQDGFTFPVTFHKYDADYYWLRDRLVEKGEEKPHLEGCEDLLLEEIGVSPEFYQITDISWDGGSYEDEKGERCRNAVAFGRKRVQDYQLLYQGVAEFPEYEMWRVAAVYELPATKQKVQEKSETIREAPLIVQIEEEGPASAAEPTLWERITRTLLITIAVGAMLFFGGLLTLAALWGKRAFLPYGRKRSRERR